MNFDTSNDTHTLVKKRLLLGKIDNPQPVYFYQRRDGSIFSCGEGEAWTVHNFYMLYGAFVGRGSGKVFHDELTRLKAWQDDEVRKLNTQKRAAAAKIRRLERKAKLTKADEKELEKLYDLDENFDEYLEQVFLKVKEGMGIAWQMELEDARGKFQSPSDQSFIGGGQRVGSDGKLLSSDQFYGLNRSGIQLT